MSPIIFGTAFAIGAGAIALWTDVRLPKLAPDEMSRILMHTMAAFVVLNIVGNAVGPIADYGPLQAMAGVFLLGLPGIVYAFLVGIWAIRLFQGAYAGSR
jgi:hypothetical protein